MGCWTIGGQYWGGTDDGQSVAAVRAAVESGISWFDTAPLYGRGHSDAILKRALGTHIDQIILATKVGVRLDGLGPAGHDSHAHSDLRPEHIVADCEASLRRLREPLDLLQVHWPCEWDTPLEDTLAALNDLKDRGWIRHVGLCNYDAATVGQARKHGVVSLQTPYSLLRREFEGQLRDACVSGDNPLGVLAYEGLCRGLLTGKYGSNSTFTDDDLRSRDDRFRGPAVHHASALARDLAAVGARLGISAAAVALGWVASRPGVTAVIAGARSPEQVRANAKAARVVDNPRVWQVVDRVLDMHGPPPRY